MKSTSQVISTFALRQGLNYIEKNPLENLNNILNWVRKVDTKDLHKNTYDALEKVLPDKDNNWNIYIRSLFEDIDRQVLKKFLSNFIVNTLIFSPQRAEVCSKRYDCNIPNVILMDPTTKCNLKCIGCWAAEYDKSASLSFDDLDRIIIQGKELGVYMYIYSGGEPLVRKDDLIKLAEKHNDCTFLAFTNGTLVDEAFAKELLRVSNFLLAISIEGYEEETDMRRGEGTYSKAIKAMDILKAHKLPFGFSTCYHRYNTDIIGSDSYTDLMIEKGCKFGWYFTYMPLGKDARTDMMVSSQQREFMYHKVREFRAAKPIFLMDFWNDGEHSGGCVAGGRTYMHINANGDVEPCAFIHYSNANIKEVSLLEALKSPLFMQYRHNQPFNENHLRPCPLLDNPDKLKQMVHESGAKSTQFPDEESVDDLTDKCQSASVKWAEATKRLKEESTIKEGQVVGI
ncbi:MAG: radical SAM protein [Clostridiaceae bacterium]|jgi:MoaA/NifB/PqqE/SkfB family radical SAM enzyme|nr:radical SAM protein [Clostridiaceae bacterium]